MSRQNRGQMRYRFAVILWAALLTLLAACQAPRTATPAPVVASPTPRPPTPTTRPTLPPAPNVAVSDPSLKGSVRLLNATKTLYDVYLDGGSLALSLSYGAPTGAIDVAAGQYTLRVLPGGKGLGNADPLVTQPLTVNKDQALVLVLSGVAAKPTISQFPINTEQVAPGQIRVMFAHLLDGVGNMTVSDDSKQVAALSAAAQSVETTSVSVNTPTLKFEADGKAILTQPVTFVDRQSYLIFVIGTPTAAQAVIIGEQTRRNAQVRAIHASTDLGPVDVKLSDQTAATHLEYGKAGDWLHLRAATYDLKVYKAGADAKANPLYSTQIALEADAILDVILFGPPDTIQHRLVKEDLSPTTSDFTRLVVLNTIPDANQLQPVIAGIKIESFAPLRFGESSPPLSLRAGPAEMVFRSDDKGTPRVVENKTAFTLKSGNTYVYVATGSGRDRAPLLINSEVGIAEPTPSGPPTNAPQMEVRFINALSDAISVDLTVNGKPLFRSIVQGRGTAPIRMMPQSVPLRLFQNGGAPIVDGTLNGVASAHITIFAVGTAKSAHLFQIVEEADPTNSTAVVRVIHASPETGRIRVDVPVVVPTAVGGSSIDRPTSAPTQGSTGIELVQVLDFTNASAARAFAPGTYNFVVRNAVDASLVGQVNGVTIEAGKRYDLVLLPGSGKQVSPDVVVTTDLSQ